MPSWEVRSLTGCAVVDAPNWLMAVTQGLPELGHADRALSDLVCDIQQDGVVQIYDPGSDLALLVRQLPEPRDVPVAVEPIGAVAVGPAADCGEDVEDDASTIFEDKAPEPSAVPANLHLPPPMVGAAGAAFSIPIPLVDSRNDSFNDADLSFFANVGQQVDSDGPPEDLAERLFEEGGDIANTNDPAEAAAAVLRSLQGVVAAESGAVLYANINDTGLRFLAATGPTAATLATIQVPFGHGIAGWVHDNGASLIVQDAASDHRHHRDVDDRTGYSTGAILAVPVRDLEGTIHGCIELLNPPERFVAWHLDAAKTVAAALAEELRVRG